LLPPRPLILRPALKQNCYYFSSLNISLIRSSIGLGSRRNQGILCRANCPLPANRLHLLSGYSDITTVAEMLSEPCIEHVRVWARWDGVRDHPANVEISIRVMTCSQSSKVWALTYLYLSRFSLCPTRESPCSKLLTQTSSLLAYREPYT
jgi:hypothetical protein